MRAFGALIIQLNQQALCQLMLDTEIPVLHVWHRQVARNCMLRCGFYKSRIKRLKLLISPRGRDARDIHTGDVVRNRVRPVASTSRPFPSEIGVIEDPISATDDSAREYAISEPNTRRKVHSLGV